MIELLKNNPTLVIDTKFYDIDFKYQILSEINNLDENTNGILINSDNFQALNLLLNKYKEKVKCCYIDPPYNTGNDGFLYKDGFSHSSWLSMMENRVKICQCLLKKEAHFYTSIDWNESHNYKKLLDLLFPSFQREIIWNTGDNISGFKSLAPNWIRQHDTIYYYTKGKSE